MYLLVHSMPVGNVGGDAVLPPTAARTLPRKRCRPTGVTGASTSTTGWPYYSKTNDAGANWGNSARSSATAWNARNACAQAMPNLDAKIRAVGGVFSSVIPAGRTFA